MRVTDKDMERGFKLLKRYPDGTEEWHKQRLETIGASEVSGVLGLSPFETGTPFKIWTNKVSGTWTDLSDKEYIEWGHRLEAPIAQWVTDHHPEIGEVKPGIDARSIEYPWLSAKPDRTIYVDGEYAANLEIKSGSAFKQSEWEQGCPKYYLVQVLTQNLVTHKRIGYLAALVGGNTTYFYRIDSSDYPELVEQIITGTEQFWKLNVERRVPPKPSDPAEAFTLWPGDDDDEFNIYVDYDGEVEEALQHNMHAVSDRKVIDDEIKMLRTFIADTVQDATHIVDPMGQLLGTYKKPKGRDYRQVRGNTQVLIEKARLTA